MRIIIQVAAMPTPAELQSLRRLGIRQALAQAPAATQQDLVAALTSQGFHATQSSVSRDLKELGAIKTSKGYELRDAEEGGDNEVASVANLLRGLSAAGPNLLVIKTAIGAAQRVALALDRCGWPEIVGNVGGDDTVFTATATAAAQRALLRKISRAASKPVEQAV
jgi:transcriptional regulator of arginine metabolism